jgi:hypothetical protein
MPPVQRRLLPALLLLMLLAFPAVASAERTFTARYATNDFGDIAVVGNTLMSCPDADAACAAGRAGTGAKLSDNDFTMAALGSSEATLTLPSGSSVLWAGLYWGADTSAGAGGAPATDAFRGAATITAPGGTPTAVTATQIDSLASSATRYHAFYDATSLVQAAGAGAYTVGGVQAGTGDDRYAGWSLVVVYKHGTQERNLRVYDGFKGVTGANVDIPMSGLLTPAGGTVHFKMGFMAYEGDLGITGDTATLDSTPLTNAANPQTNFFNSSISDASGTAVTAKSPDYVNQLGFDLDQFSLDGVLGNNVTSTTMHLTTTGDVYAPGVITTSIDRANTPPSTGTPPSVSGTARDGSPLTVTPGVWSGTPSITYDYQWKRCDSSGASCADIGGATSTTYTPDGGDVGSTMRVLVTATNPIGTSSTLSGATGAVAPVAPSLVVAPVITGTARDGSTLSVGTGTWSGSPTIGYAYQWRRCAPGCADIPGATSSTYTLGQADVGATLRAVVTASNAAGSASAQTDAGDVVAAPPPPRADPAPTFAPPRLISPPVVSGVRAPGQTLTATTGTWESSEPLVYRYQWRSCATDGTDCRDIAGATARTYVVRSEDRDRHLEVVVVAASSQSAATASATGRGGDLSDLEDSRVADSSCVRLSSAVVARPLRAGRLGTFRLSLRSATTKVTTGVPARAGVFGPMGHLRGVRFSLDGRALRDARHGRAVLRPDRLRPGSHRLIATLLPRHPGRWRRVALVLRSARCSALFTASRRPGLLTRALLMRVDSRRAVSALRVHLPAATARGLARTAPGAELGWLRVVARGRRVAWRVRGPRDGRLTAANAPSVRVVGKDILVSGLPAQTGIATLSLIRPAKAGARTPALTLASEVRTATGWQRLTSRLPGGRGAGA